MRLPALLSVTACALLLLAASAPRAHYGHHGAALLPDPVVTPGATLGVGSKQVCTRGWAGRHRNVKKAEKLRVCGLYGMVHCDGRHVEIDHLVSLELGGSNDVHNLWPQPWVPKPGAYAKDQTENWTHRQVCSGKMSLQHAEREMRTDWTVLYDRMLREKRK